MTPIYLDYNATTPIDSEVADIMVPYLRGHYGNPSSGHVYGVEANQAVHRAREQVARLLGCDPEEVVFTSGGTESNNTAIWGAALAGRERGNHIITTSIEHPAVMEVCRHLDSHGFRTTYVPVDEYGMTRLQDVERSITEETILITVMHANNEVGTIQPVESISVLARDRGIPVHTDAAQSVGKIPTRVDDLGIDFLSVAGHKLYAPKGVGALYVRRGAHFEKLMFGAGHEQGRRPGTENVLEIAGLGAACEIAARDLEGNGTHMAAMRNRLEAGFLAALDEVRVNGHPDQRLPNTLSLSFRGVEANALLSQVPEIAASPGAACHSGEVQVSRVLEAMGVSPEYALGTVRFSTGRGTTVEDIDRAVEIVVEAVKRLRQSTGKT